MQEETEVSGRKICASAQIRSGLLPWNPIILEAVKKTPDSDAMIPAGKYESIFFEVCKKEKSCVLCIVLTCRIDYEISNSYTYFRLDRFEVFTL